MALSNIFEYIEGFKAIGHRINDGTSNGEDIVKATEIATKLVDDLLLLDKNSKIVYEPTKLRASSVIEQNIYVAMMATTLGLKANSLGMLNYIGSVIIPNESALFRIS